MKFVQQYTVKNTIKEKKNRKIKIKTSTTYVVHINSIILQIYILPNRLLKLDCKYLTQTPLTDQSLYKNNSR